MAMECKCPVVPVTVTGARSLLPPRGLPMMGWCDIALVIHPPISVDDGDSEGAIMEKARIAIESGLRDCDK